ncbi:MAG: septum formation protein Maf [Actinobacteria bacterium]|nr:septum formation protein Maf [Actinomycetota bacterium]
MTRPRLVLASRSPRRTDLLRSLLDESAPEAEFEVAPADVDEVPLAGEAPRDMVVRLALAKARAVAARVGGGAMVIGADTTVELDGESLGQPADADAARATLRRLSGRTHLVHTGVAVLYEGAEAPGVDTARVTFVPLTDALVDWYVSTGEPMDKAGAYGIQGRGAVLVDRVEGQVSTVVGLPLRLLAGRMAALGWK